MGGREGEREGSEREGGKEEGRSPTALPISNSAVQLPWS